MKCPECKQEIGYVNVYSECYQKGYINEKGEIEDYGNIEEILGIKDIECPKCYHVITENIKFKRMILTEQSGWSYTKPIEK